VLALIVAATLTCVGALYLGGVASWLCGRDSWTPLSVPVGLALLMLISMVAIHVPGHATTVAVVFLVAALAGLPLVIRNPGLRPRPTDLLTAAPVFVLVLLPFLASGRAGTLGVSFDIDMRIHLLYAEAIRSPAVAKVTSISGSYPVGPHALCAVLAQATGTRVDYDFAGETMAIPILLAWTTLGALRRVGWLGKTFVATMSSVTFLFAGYYAEGAFKEIMQALFVLAFALGLEELVRGQRRGPLRWVPLALIAGGSLSVYSDPGLLWPLAVLASWLAIHSARRVWRSGSFGSSIAWLRSAVAPSSVAVGVLLVLLVPQLPRLAHFLHTSSGIKVTELGNLEGWGALSLWKVFGMWDVPDFRMPAADPFHAGMFAALGLVVTVVGGLWWLRRGELAVPLTAAVALAIWVYSSHTQSPYVSAKALVILAPLVMLIATRWLVEPQTQSWLSGMVVLRLGLIGVLGWAVIGTSVELLRNADVGSTAHLDDLRSLQPVLDRSPTLFLGRDLYIKWELAGTPVDQPDPENGEYKYLPLRPQKAWKPGEAMDFDDVTSATLDKYRYVITIRDAAGSQPPSNMRLVRNGSYYQVWERVGPTPERQILAEGQEPGAVLDCATPQGQALAHSRGEAAVREPNILTPLPTLMPGQSARASVRLRPGTWILTEPYISNYPIDVTAPGLHVTLPANLDWPGPGPRWPVGRITVTDAAPVIFTFHVRDTLLAPSVLTNLAVLVATANVAPRMTPLSRACGRYVDWYTLH
jgi:hypothetical protein